MSVEIRANPLIAYFLRVSGRVQLPGLRIQRYIAKEYLFYFTVSFLFFLAIFFVNQILVLAREQLAEMISVFDTLRLVLYAMPSIIALSVPYASFIGIILAIGKLSEGREILAARASGIGFHVLFTPIVITALMLSSFSFFTNDYLIPVSITNYSRLYQELLYSNTRLIIEPYSIRNFNGSILITGAVNDQSIDGLTILDTTDNGTKRTISSTRAELLRDDQQQGIIALSLKNVEIASLSNNIIQLSSAETMNYNILLENIVFNINNPSVREMSVRDVSTLIGEQNMSYQEQLAIAQRDYYSKNAEYQSNIFAFADKQDADIRSRILGAYTILPDDPDNYLHDRSLRLYRLEFWKKFSIPLACLTFIFLGFPLGMLALKSGRTLSIVMGFSLSGAYWGLLTINEVLGIELISVPAILIAFLPNIAMLTAGIAVHYFYFRN